MREENENSSIDTALPRNSREPGLGKSAETAATSRRAAPVRSLLALLETLSPIKEQFPRIEDLPSDSFEI
jgi:hypothetical protein